MVGSHVDSVCILDMMWWKRHFISVFFLPKAITPGGSWEKIRQIPVEHHFRKYLKILPNTLKIIRIKESLRNCHRQLSWKYHTIHKEKDGSLLMQFQAIFSISLCPTDVCPLLSFCQWSIICSLKVTQDRDFRLVFSWWENVAIVFDTTLEI